MSHTNTHTHVHTKTLTYTQMHTQIHTFTHNQSRTHIYTHSWMQTYMFTHICMHTNYTGTHIQTHTCFRWVSLYELQCNSLGLFLTFWSVVPSPHSLRTHPLIFPLFTILLVFLCPTYTFYNKSGCQMSEKTWNIVFVNSVYFVLTWLSPLLYIYIFANDVLLCQPSFWQPFMILDLITV